MCNASYHDTSVCPAAVYQLDVQHRANLNRFCDEDNKALEVDYR